MALFQEQILTSYIHIKYNDGSVAVVVLYLPLDIVDNEELKKQFVFKWESQNLNWDNIESIDDEWSKEDV